MADPPTFRPEQTGDPATDRMQRVVADVIGKLSDIPFLWGKRVNDVLVTSTITVRHGLGRRASGYIVLRSFGTGGEVPLDLGPGADPLNEQVLTAGANSCEVDLWFF